MSENSKIELYELDGELVSLHPIYCDCSRCSYVERKDTQSESGGPANDPK